MNDVIEAIDFGVDASWLVHTAGSTRHLWQVAGTTVLYRRLPGPGRADWQGSTWFPLHDHSEVRVGQVFTWIYDPGGFYDYLTRRSSTVTRIERISEQEMSGIITRWEAEQPAPARSTEDKADEAPIRIDDDF